jgi:hypothetical protein
LLAGLWLSRLGAVAHAEEADGGAATAAGDPASSDGGPSSEGATVPAPPPSLPADVGGEPAPRIAQGAGGAPGLPGAAPPLPRSAPVAAAPVLPPPAAVVPTPASAAAEPSPATAVAAGAAAAPVSSLDTVIVTGLRGGPPRTVANSPAPIDVISNEQLLNTGRKELGEALASLLPSFNFGTNQGGITSIVRPVSNRGLGPGYTLVLVNGKRRHNCSQLTNGGGDTSGSNRWISTCCPSAPSRTSRC